MIKLNKAWLDQIGAVEAADIAAADTVAVVDTVGTVVAAVVAVVADIGFLDNNFRLEHYNYFDY